MKRNFVAGTSAIALLLLSAGCGTSKLPLEDRVTHAYVDNGGVKIHYVSLGKGPLVVLIHGFPDYWYTWHAQIEALATDHRVVALDLRGYNLSDKPQGVAAYSKELLASDVASVIRDCGEKKAVLIGHDWGGMVAWQVALYLPDLVDKLIVLDAPHPEALLRELGRNPLQQKRSQYAQSFKRPGMEALIQKNAESLLSWLDEPVEKAKHLEVLRRADFVAMFNYYRANYPDPPPTPVSGEVHRIDVPLLVIYGLEDQAFAPETLDGSWGWSTKDVTVVALPGVGHWVQYQAAAQVNRIMRKWLEP